MVNSTSTSTNKDLMAKFREHKRRCVDDFPYFARTDLLVDAKGGGRPVPFVLNEAQRYVYSRFQAQRDRLGFIRMNILKGRQQGMSTMVAAFFFHQCVTRYGIRALIVSKDAKATRSVFAKIKRYAVERPISKDIEVGACNMDEISFPKTDSSIICQTARADNVARGSTFSLVHLSECPYWDHAEEQVAAIMDAVPRVKGTAIILESTARGRDSLFYPNYKLGESGKSDWESCFVPWFWQSEYRIDISPDEDWQILPSEHEVMEKYNLSPEQIKWRRYKLFDYKRADPLAEWNREYPSCPSDAFEATSKSEFFDMERVKAALDNQPLDCRYDNLYIGVDIGSSGDPSIACFRRGLNVERFAEYKSDSLDLTEDWIRGLIRSYKPHHVCIDNGPISMQLCQHLKRDFPSVVHPISFGGSPDDGVTYSKKRAEMCDRVRMFFANNTCYCVSNPDLIADMQVIAALPDKAKLTMIDKDSLRKSLGRSTDNLDALMLTFATDISKCSRGVVNGPSITYMPHPELRMFDSDFAPDSAPGIYSSSSSLGAFSY